MDAWIIIFLTETASVVELRNATDAEITFFVRSMEKPSVKGISIGSEAFPKQRARIFISLTYLFGSTTQTIMNFMSQDRLGPNALCVLEGRSQFCTYFFPAKLVVL